MRSTPPSDSCRSTGTERSAWIPPRPYAMQRLIGMKDTYDIAFACDTDHDRHGIVTASGGLLPPNHYLSVAVDYLFRHRPSWKPERRRRQDHREQRVDRPGGRAARSGGCTRCRSGSNGSSTGCCRAILGSAERKAPAPRSTGSTAAPGAPTRTASRPALLAAEITARFGRDPGEAYRALARELGEPFADRVEAPRDSGAEEEARQARPLASPRHGARRRTHRAGAQFTRRETTHPSAASRSARKAAGSPRGLPAPRTSTRSTARAFATTRICAPY